MGIKMEPIEEVSATGNSAKEHGGQDIHLGKAAPHPADTGIGEGDETAGNATLAHDLTGQDKEGNSQQREGLHAVDHALEQRGQRNI